MRKGLVIDCFAGGGGASEGIEQAIGRPVDIAINHDLKAIMMHKVNHPDTLHITEDIFKVELEDYVKGQHVSLMWASPDCTQFSKAKGGQPRKNGLRMLPWAVYKHAKAVRPDVLVMENVEEIQKWDDYARFVSSMIDLGYTFDCRELVAADYGAPTTRKRWYAVLRCDGRTTEWPEQTNSPGGLVLSPWVPASRCIDFSDLGESIFERRRPLAAATVNRIERGIKRFVVDDAPFVVDGNASFITKFYHTGVGQSLREPLHTITTSAGHFGLVTCFLTKYYGQGTGQSLNVPLGTITTKDRFGLVTVCVDGDTYRISDVRLRMLKPEELKIAQGFPSSYIIDRYEDGSSVPVAEQVKRIGNSVVPMMARAIVSANVA